MTQIKEVELQVVKLKKAILTTVAACIAALALMLPMAGGAQAAEQQFCWGANLSPNGGKCSSGYWNMNAAYANSMNGPICILLPGAANCSRGANQGVYINQGYCGYSGTTMVNWNTFWIKGYGTFWTC